MTATLAPRNAPLPRRIAQPTLKSHLAFTLLGGAALLALYTLLRIALLVYNRELIGDTPSATFIEAFYNGLRFDVRLVVYALTPLLLALLSVRAMAARGLLRWWLTAFASFTLLLGITELDFYREFHQRLNGLVFQYFEEDLATVGSMLWNGFPVGRYLLAWAIATWLLATLFKGLDRISRPVIPALHEESPPQPAYAAPTWYWRSGLFLLCALLAVVAARGHLRQGPPLRWGDAYTTNSMFANQLGLNGSLTLLSAAEASMSSQRSNSWQSTMPDEQALDIVRQLLLTPHDRLVDADNAAIRRDFTPPADRTLPIRNVVVILMESFAGHFVGALGGTGDITPHFDALAREGLLFDRFFSNGTHTHQGMFATMACFPNLPAFEYLMRTPEGAHKFSGLPQLLSARGYDNLYVYNGNFQWDNQSGFFSNQGMTRFIGREDFVDPVYMDPTWGVSDQDMFDRAAAELDKLPADKPFYALLQTLSNHTPYALPKVLPIERVTDRGIFGEHLTAMRYADWALGEFFAKARKSAYYKHTLFVVVGDHGFGSDQQLTEMDLFRFNVPLLLLAPGIQDRFGSRNHHVGTQVDVVPTIMGRLGGTVRHQCWGRDLLNLPEGDLGIGVIKPSGGDQTVALVTPERILIEPKGFEPRLYSYQLGADPKAERIPLDLAPELKAKLEAFLQMATRSLLDNTAGVEAAMGHKP
ncbi:MAG: Lipoteichoic acid synthase 1 [Candidatus Accumulibacter regalis]|uniref:Lipoteichoic acid synthase 1 n=1 Tax=Accumulibacter regalis TaxID=522306 RepID=A0A011RBF5_ACCRE|nr:LTA synthase family protein [Accumulibacter sp.]EXI88514.1 MAG: Lipoteichoic acid synthase 1 [Candidatus Accumulibacter regalis]MBN8514948.1 LTA synthase family protein [Accumulibacter sp.]MBO3702024.1 LTA synthase family protein [Accumulibacter sp.]HRE71903.1 LTA synthase family protein [Accumulibacter sp.]